VFYLYLSIHLTSNIRRGFAPALGVKCPHAKLVKVVGKKWVYPIPLGRNTTDIALPGVFQFHVEAYNFVEYLYDFYKHN
jgi:hypothetical protein